MSQGFVSNPALRDIHVTPTPHATVAELTAERKSAIIGRAREILAGQFQPSAMELSEELEAQLRREFQGKDPQPDTAALQRIMDRLCLESQYKGQPVAWCEMAGGRLAVLAFGAPEVETILLGLSDDELVNVVVFQADQY